MKLIHIIIITLLSTSFLYAQDIANARTQAIGASVTISGIVTNGDELGPVRYIEDATAGIAVYDPTNLTGVDRGDSITVTGNLIDYNGLLEIQPVSSFTDHGNGYTITPQLITPLQIDENTEAELVEIQNTIIDNGGSNFTQGLHNFTSNGESGILYLRSGHPLIGQIIPTGPITIIGISSQYTFTGSGGYQLLPRDEDDLVLGSGINITSALQQTNLNNTSFDLSWTTDLAGFSSLVYGISENNLIDTINISGSNTSHSVNLSALTAGTIFYAQGFSVNGTDTAFTAVGIFATVSNSSGAVRAYFNKSVDNSVSITQNAQNIGTAINDTIKAYIDKAQYTLDIAIYNHSDALITTAINDAYNRGVIVRYLTCASTSSLAVSNLDPSIPVFEKPNGVGIMHNKFVIVDANVTDSCWVLTGSTNWTSGQLFDDPNNLIAIQDQSIARTYEIEFNEMWGSKLELPDANNALFGSSKKNNTPHHFLVNGSAMEVHFSPSDNTTNKIVDAIETTNNNLNFALLVFTNNDLGWAIEDLHNSGVSVQGIIEQTNTTGSEYQYLVDAGVDVRSHTGVSNIFHHKYCIIDQAIASSDPTLITGSHNWSAAAENDNDENTIIYHNQNIANQYYQEFIERFNELTPSAIEESAHPSSTKKLLYISDPLGRKMNPKKGSIQFLIYDDGSVEKKFLLTP
jgi:phosphatidylserine/phosphatidylglycerophosphate/cardiolipin synthase-like enzyme